MKKINLLLSVALLTGMVTMGGCDDKNSSSNNPVTSSSSKESEMVDYLLTVKTIGGNRLNDIELNIYENEELVAITKELTDALRKNKTIDWQKREGARAKMRMLIKKLLKKHKYPPEGVEDAVQVVMTQCELWTDNVMEA